MSDTKEIERISRMGEGELLDYVLSAPDNLTDRYYAHFGAAIRKRRAELKAEQRKPVFLTDRERVCIVAAAEFMREYGPDPDPALGGPTDEELSAIERLMTL